MAFRRMDKRALWTRWRPLAVPSLFFLGVLYYEELFLKLYCFGGVSLPGAFFTLLFSVPVALVMGLLCRAGGRRGPEVLAVLTILLSTWMGSQAIYSHLF